MKRVGILAFCVISSISASAFADGVDGNAVLGGALGGAAGAAVGSAIGGRDGAMVGAGLGGVAGVAVATSGRKAPVRTRERVVYVHEREHHDNGRHLGHYKHRRDHGHDD